MNVKEAGQGAAGPRSTCKTPARPPDGAKILTVPEAAWELRSSVDTVYRLIARGELPSTSVAKKRFVLRKDIDVYLAGQTTVRKPDAAAPGPARIGLRESGLWNGKDY